MARYERSWRALLMGAAAALVYFVGLGRPALWEPDEGRYAEVAREMAVSGDYLTPRNNGVRYFEKPPLFYWTVAISIRTFGRDEFAVRLPSALAGAATVAVVEALGEVMFGAISGMLAASALGLSPLFFIFARFAAPDMLLTLFITAALASFYAAATGGGFVRRRARWFMIGSAALLAVATLVKGPVALLLGGLIALLWIIGERRTREILQIRWLECIAAFLLISVPWFVIAATANPGFLGFFFIHEHVQRFLSAAEHGWGWWFFLPIAMVGTWPFFYFAPWGLAGVSRSELGSDPPHYRSALRFLLIWFVTVLVFFSIPRAKLAEYLLPAFPPLALLAGLGMARLRLVEHWRARRILGGFAAINMGLAIAIGGALAYVHSAGIPAAGKFWKFADPLLATDSLGRVVLDAALICILLGVGAMAVWWIGTESRVSRAPLVVVVLGMLGVAAVAKARQDATAAFSYRSLAHAIAPYTDRGCHLASYHHFVQALPFYTGTTEALVGYRGELAPFGDSPDAQAAFIATDRRLIQSWSAGGCMVLVANRGDLGKLAETLIPRPKLIAGEGKKLALINCYPPASAQIGSTCSKGVARAR